MNLRVSFFYESRGKTTHSANRILHLSSLEFT